MAIGALRSRVSGGHTDSAVVGVGVPQGLLSGDIVSLRLIPRLSDAPLASSEVPFITDGLPP